MSTDTTNTDKKEKPCGCGGTLHMPEMDKDCVAPAPLPWAVCHNCLKWYLVNIVSKTTEISIPITSEKTNKGTVMVPVTIEFEITYEMSLCLKGRQPGKLLYTTSLIPQEEVKLYISDRYRRTTNETYRYSTHSSFRNNVAALFQSQQSNDLSQYEKNINSSTSGGGGGASFNFLGIFSIGGGGSGSSSSSGESITSLQQSLQTFHQTLVSASSAVEADRSIVISNFEEQDNLQTTSRTLKNYNNCRAVTYYIRKIDEVYELSATIVNIRWRVKEGRLQALDTNWQSAADVNTIQNADLKKFIEHELKLLPQLNDTIKHNNCITLTTDGTVIEAELAHCSSCDPERMLELEVHLEKERAAARRLYMESEFMSMEIERRKKLLDAGNLSGFDTPPTVKPATA